MEGRGQARQNVSAEATARSSGAGVASNRQTPPPPAVANNFFPSAVEATPLQLRTGAALDFQVVPESTEV
jgi:hypothetical protein